MNKEQFLNRKWNLIISLVQGIPTFSFALYAIVTGFADSRIAMIAISVAGSLFCLILELHSSLRFAAQWNSEAPHPKSDFPIFLTLHNLAWWFFLLPLLKLIPYGAGFISFTAILFFRFLANSYMNLKNFDSEKYYRYPFRIP